MQAQATNGRSLRVLAGAKCVKLLCALLIGYVAAYVILSASGSYEPNAYSLRGVIDYEWAPFGFYSKTIPQGIGVHDGWNRTMLRVFFPLWCLDIRLRHRVSFDGKAPASP